MSLLGWTLGQLPRNWVKSAARLQWKHPALKTVFEFVSSRLRHQDTVIQAGLGKGLRFNAGNSNAGYVLGTSEPNLQRAFDLLLTPGMTLYDVGASVGFQSMLAARKVGAAGKVFCFEPVDANAGWVRHNAALNGFTNVQVEAVALGEKDGEAAFVFSDHPNWGHLANVSPSSRAGDEHRVPIRRLDSLVDQKKMTPPNAIKMDVEGAEAQVLAGAMKTLKRFSPLLFIDLHGTNVAVADALEPLGYTLHVLGRPGMSVRSAPWDVQVLAIPAARSSELAPLVSRLVGGT